MKFTLDWLKAPLQTDASLDTIATTLTAIGLEVEEIDDKGKLLAPFTVAEIIETKQHPDADRLKVCTVNTGTDTLQIVCGAPNARAGLKTVLSRPGDFIPGLNKTLTLGKIRGVESQGMLCAADELGLGTDHAGIMELPAEAPVGAKLLDIMPQAGTVVIDINLTPNRGDCAGVYGIARDLAAAGLGTLKPLPTDAIPAAFDNSYTVTVENPADCPAFALRLIRGVTNGASPAWLRGWLEAIGIAPISALVDITNFLTHDLARPLHVFDAAKVQGQQLTIRRARAGEKLAALNNKTYDLSPELLVIADDAGVESLAGVIGGLHSGCSEATTDVLVECALFDPIRVATAGRALQINSDARYRFERGIDPASLTYGMEIATKMILDICGGQASSVVTVGQAATTRATIDYDPALPTKLAGLDIAADKQQDLLTRLGCTVAANGDGFAVTPPSWRPDLTLPQDLVEEVLRLTGYDAIPATSLPPLTTRAPALAPVQRRRAAARRALAVLGYDEIVSWSFMPPTLAAEFGATPPQLHLVNPISVELSAMRPSILGNLMEIAARNAARGQHDAALFEVGPVYRDVGDKGQETVAAALLTGAATPRHWTSGEKPVDLFAIKADLAALLAEQGLDLDAVPLTREAPAHFHPGRSFALRLGPTVIAYAGELHPRLLANNDLSRAPVAAFELFLDRLPLPKAKGAAKPLLALPPLQAVTRDFAFLTPADLLADTLLKAVRKADRNAITDVRLFDIYQDAKALPGQKSLALTVTLQPTGDKAFTDVELEALAQTITAAAAKIGATLRG